MLAKLTACVMGVALVAFAAAASRAMAEEHAPASAESKAAADAHGDAHGGVHGHDHIGAGNPGPDLGKPEEFKQDLAFFTFVVFLVLLAILWKFAWGPIIEALERREKLVADHIAQAELNHAEAKRLLAEYERKLDAAAGEVRELMEEARRDAEKTKQSILAEAKAGAEAERVRALRDIDSATDAALESLSKRSADLAVDLAGKILQAQLSPADHARLISEAMAKFPAHSAN